jgi:hypothetical protein
MVYCIDQPVWMLVGPEARKDYASASDAPALRAMVATFVGVAEGCVLRLFG